MSERERIETKLAELTGTPGDIAAKLHENGITGVPNVPERCVIAQWIDEPVWKGDGEVGEPQGYYVESGGIMGKPIALPPHLQHFVALFDNGDFPDLIN